MMASKQKGGTYLGNTNLPTGNAEFEYTPEMLKHIKRSKKNVLYFAEYFFFIIDPDEGRQRIRLFPFQKRCLRTLRDNRKCILLCSRQVGKTTLLTVYALWEACFNNDKNIVIVANKESTAKEIFRRVKMSYEELPNWLKPGVDEWGQTGCKFSNGSRVWISTTTGSSARGATINVLLLDELAFIEPPSMLEDFWRSVYPTISRAKTSKVLIASTPNGVGNLFHRLVSESEKGKNEFKLETVMWDEIPGRDEAWKQAQISELGSLESFLQEYENHFIDSGDSSIDESTYEKLKQNCIEAPIILEEGKYHIWDEPDPDKLYVAGIDVAEGVGQDYSVINILDITEIREIKQVAVWSSNTMVPAEFTNKCYEILQNWGNPFALIERNNQGSQVVDRLGYDMGYENIVSYGAKSANRSNVQLGMISHTNTKYKAVTNMRYFLNEMLAVVVRDIKTLKELKTFVRLPNGTWKAERDQHDDRVMSMAWALMVLEKEITERYFEISKVDDFGKPLKLEKMDFGVKYFENPTSIYTGNNTGQGSTNVSPIMFGWGTQFEDDYHDLELEGWKSLANT
jgi:hypothetical protein